MKKLYIYEKWDGEPLGAPTVVAIIGRCKLRTMNVEDIVYYRDKTRGVVTSY